MPTYEYACKKCGEHLEVQQSFKDDPLTKCPACGGVLRKVFGSIGIAFKGSGFYKTDSRSTAKGASKSVAKTDGAGSTSEKSTSDKSTSDTSTSSSSSSDKSSDAKPSSSGSSGTTSDKKAAAAAS